MTTQRFNYAPIKPGFDWAMVLHVSASTSLFPIASRFKAAVRYDGCAPVLTTLTTEAGTLVRVDDNRLDFKISGAASAKWDDSVVLDLVRTDGETPRHMNIRIRIAVKKSLTDAECFP